MAEEEDEDDGLVKVKTGIEEAKEHSKADKDSKLAVENSKKPEAKRLKKD